MIKVDNGFLLLWLLVALSLCFDGGGAVVAGGSSCADNDNHNGNKTTTITSASGADTCQDGAASSRWAGPNLSEVLNSWNFTTDEEASLFELRDRVADIEHWKNDPAELARFVKEHNFDVEKAEKMFRGMIEWRKQNNVDDFMQRYGEPPEVFRYAPLFLLKGLDKDNDPIFVQRIGALDALGLYQRLGDKAMIEACQFVQEIQTSREVGIREGWRWQREYYEPLVGRRMTQFTMIVDLEGMGSRLLRPALLSVLQQTARVAQDWYPGLAKRMIFLRAPSLFKMAWRIAKHFFDPRVEHKFIFSSHADYLEVLSEYVDLEVLPSVIYPEGNGTQMPGFFEKIHMEGGRIPPPRPPTTTTTTTN